MSRQALTHLMAFATAVMVALSAACKAPRGERNSGTANKPTAARSATASAGADREKDRLEDIISFGDWAATGGLESPAAYFAPEPDCAQYTDDLAKPSKAPCCGPDGFCAAYYKSPSGWMVHVRWKAQMDNATELYFLSLPVLQPIDCEVVHGTLLRKLPRSDDSDRFSVGADRLCRLADGYAILTWGEDVFGDGNGRAGVGMVTDGFLRHNKESAERFRRLHNIESKE